MVKPNFTNRTTVKLMIKDCIYWRSSVRDNILVEKRTFPARRRRPVRDGMLGKHCVPNGTPRFVCTFVFYQYRIPNGMTKSICQFIINTTLCQIFDFELCQNVFLSFRAFGSERFNYQYVLVNQQEFALRGKVGSSKT